MNIFLAKFTRHPSILLIFTKRLKGGNFHSKNMHRAIASWCFSHHLGPKDCPRMVLQHRKHIGTDRATKLFTTRWENCTLFVPYIGSQVAYWLLTLQKTDVWSILRRISSSSTFNSTYGQSFGPRWWLKHHGTIARRIFLEWKFPPFNHFAKMIKNAHFPYQI